MADKDLDDAKKIKEKSRRRKITAAVLAAGITIPVGGGLILNETVFEPEAFHNAMAYGKDRSIMELYDDVSQETRDRGIAAYGRVSGNYYSDIIDADTFKALVASGISDESLATLTGTLSKYDTQTSLELLQVIQEVYTPPQSVIDDLFVRFSRNGNSAGVEYMADNFDIDYQTALLSLKSALYEAKHDTVRYLFERFSITDQDIDEFIQGQTDELAFSRGDGRELYNSLDTIHRVLGSVGYTPSEEVLGQALAAETRAKDTADIEYLVDNFTFSADAIQDAFKAAAANGSTNIVAMYMDSMEISKDSLIEAFVSASQNNQTNVIWYLTRNGIEEIEGFSERAFEAATESASGDVLILLAQNYSIPEGLHEAAIEALVRANKIDLARNLESILTSQIEQLESQGDSAIIDRQAPQATQQRDVKPNL